MGDDLIDLPLLKRVGWSASVPKGRPEVRREVDYITHSPAGGGAFREVVEKILKTQKRWTRTLKLLENMSGPQRLGKFSKDLIV